MSQHCHKDKISIGNKPQGSKVVLQRRGGRYVYVETPPPGWNWLVVIMLTINLGLWICPATFGVVSLAPLLADQPFNVMPFILLSICFLVGLGICALTISTCYNRQVLHIGRERYGVWSERRFSKRKIQENCQEDPAPSQVLGRTRNLELAALIPATEVNTDNATKTSPYLEIREGIRIRQFGRGLERIELEWILKEVNEAIGELTAADIIGVTENTRAGTKHSQFGDEDNLEISDKPYGSKVVLQRSRRGYFYVEIPPSGWTWGLTFILVFILIVMSPFTTIFVMLAFQLADAPFLALPMLICSMSMLTGFGMMALTISTCYSRQVLHIGKKTYTMWTARCFSKADMEANSQEEPDSSRVLGATRNLKMAALIHGGKGEDSVGPHLEIREGNRKMKFGLGLKLIELEWILNEVNEAIAELTSSADVPSMV